MTTGRRSACSTPFDEKRLYLTHIELRDELEVFDDVELWGEARA